MAGIEPEEILLTKLSKLFGGPEHVKAYETLKTDSERINFVYHSPIVTELFKLQSQALKKSIQERSGEGLGKSESETTRWRELGNQSFKTGKDIKAMEQYSVAMVYAPRPYEKCSPKKKNGFVLAAANRSAVHVRLGNFASALQDIELALKTGDHPSPSKLIERRALCLEKLGRFNEAVRDLESTIEELLKEEKNSPKIEELKAKIQVLRANENDVISNEEELPEFHPHPYYPALSDVIKIEYTKQRGRYGVAARDIQVGETLVIETPTASRIKPNEASDHCDTCLRYICGSQIPCPMCVSTCYCSIECLEKAKDSFHQHECLATGGMISNFLEDFLIKVKGNEGAVNFYRLCFRLVSQKNLDFFKTNRDLIEKPDEKYGAKIKEGEMFLPGDYKSTLNLVRHIDSDTTGSMVWLIMSAAFQLRTLQLSGFFGPNRRFAPSDVKLDEDELFIGKVIIHIFQLLRYNAHGILEQIYDEKRKPDEPFDWHSCWKTHSIATGIYPTLALLNHSCDPNISKYFIGPKVFAVANRIIFKGEEITENYFPYYTHMPKRERIPWLMDHYRFECGCVACNQDFPTRREMKDGSDFYFRCQKCRAPMPKVSENSELRCPGCNHVEPNSEQIWKRITELQKKVETSQHLYHRDLTEENLGKLLLVTNQDCGELSTYLLTPTKTLQDGHEWYSALIRRLKCSRRAKLD